MNEYTVALDQLYRGPADLLLQLVKEEELNVAELPLSKLCEGFLQHLQALSKADLDNASDFLVIAATLMWMKSNAILPHEAVNLDEDLDPRDELLGRLLEYRRFRDAAAKLGGLADVRAQRFERGGRESAEPEPEIEMENLSSWDLLENFARLMKETLFDRPITMKGDAKPIAEYAKELYGLLRTNSRASFGTLFEGAKERGKVIGYFLALLELVKQGFVGIEQKDSFGEIELVLQEGAPEVLDLKQIGEISNG